MDAKIRALFLSFILTITSALAAEYWVSPDGKADAPGSRAAPWNLDSALSGAHAVPPGSTIWVGGGTYRYADRSPNAGYVVRKLRGTEKQPIRIRGVEGSRVTLDGGLSLGTSSDAEGPEYVWVEGLEITVSEPGRVSQQTGSWPNDLKAPYGGVNLQASRHCKLINLVIQDNAGSGIGAWSPSQDTEIYGCIIAGNGWIAPDRGHGHGIYAQNKDGWKTVRHCIITTPKDRGDQLAQFYGSGNSFLNNFRVEENIAYAAAERPTRFLLGGGALSRNHHVRGNLVYNASIQLGYAAKGNTGGQAVNNVIFRGSLNVQFYQDCEVRQNLIVAGGIGQVESPNVKPAGNTFLRIEEAPAEPKVVVLPNQYDPARAHVAIFNWRKAPSVEVPVSGFLKVGDAYRVYDPTKFYGEPLHEGKCQGPNVTLPMNGEFAAFVMKRS